MTSNFSPAQKPHGGGTAQSVLELSFEVHFDLIEGLLALVDEWANKNGASKDDCISLRLILEELLLNLCMHAVDGTDGGTVKADLAITPVQSLAEPQNGEQVVLRRFLLSLKDSGPAFNPLLHEATKVSTIEQTETGGHGLTLVRLLATGLQYKRQHGSNTLSLTLALGSLTATYPAESSGGGISDAEAAHLENKGGGKARGFATLWKQNLPVRQAALFFTIAAFVLWGALFFYYMAMNASRLENSRRLCEQALYIQDVVSSTFLQRLTRNFVTFTGELSTMQNYEEILDSDDTFYRELKSGVLLRSITAEIPVVGVLKGEKGKQGAMLIYNSDHTIKYTAFPFNFDALLEKSEASGQPVWAGPFHELPGKSGYRHAGMFIGKSMTMKDGTQKWLGLLIAMPWIADTLNKLSGFDNAVSLFVSDTAEYVIYPPSRGIHGGPQGLLEENGANEDLQQLVSSIKAGARGFVPLEELFDNGEQPWPLPWQGNSHVAYTPMSVPGWSFILVVSSKELKATPPELPVPMLLLALFGPCFIGLLAFKTASNVVAPLRRLSKSLDRIADGDLDTPLEQPKAQDEISGMFHAFENVRVTLKHSFANLMETTAAGQRVRNELALARGIQESMLPASPPDIPGLSLAAHIDMAGEVCGDLFDFFTLPDDPHSLYCLIGDVCGKGIPASIIMSRTTVLARAALLSGKGPADALGMVNTALLRHNSSMMFVTLLVARLDVKTGVLAWASAGHPPPVLGEASSGKQPVISGPLPWTKELVLGIKENVSYTSHTTQLVPGQSLLFYTDGADEAMAPNPEGKASQHPGESEGLEIFGEERLHNVFIRACSANKNGCLPTPLSVLESTRTALLGHMGDAPPFDDISLIVVRWDG